MSERTIPSDQPRTVSTYTLSSDGEAVPRTVHLLSLITQHEIGRVPIATVVVRDGEPARETFAVSGAAYFEPGKQIEVKLGFRGSDETVFIGVVVRQTIKVQSGGSLLVVDLKDRAERMTVRRASRYFQESTDSEIIESLIDGHRLEKDVESTNHQHLTIVQHNVTDWDMMLCRAEAAGKFVFVRDGKLSVKAPDLSADPKLTIQFGATVHELDATLDARLQPEQIRTINWDPAQQGINTSIVAEEPEVPAVGNLEPARLAEVFASGQCPLVHGASLPDAELQAWADAKLVRHRLGKIRGRVTVDGTPSVTAGDFIELLGVGERFEGKLYVTGVAHALEDGVWRTSYQFGLDPKSFVLRFEDVMAPPAGGLIPAIHGLQVGVVVALEGDPDGEGRIRVRIPVIHPEDQGAWCRLATLDAGNERGTWFRPELEDEVIVGFIDSDPRHAVVLGQMHSSAKPPPEAGSDDNHLKGYQSRSKLRLTFDDDQKVIVLETPEGNRITLSEQDGKVEIADQNDNKIIMDESGIRLSSATDIVLEAQGTLKGTAQQAVEIEGSQSAKLKSGMGSELALGGTADLSGPMVNIN
jgi:Rhs element Vgr protein